MNLKINFIFFAAVSFFSIASLYAQTNQDSVKTNPKYEYAFLYLSNNINYSYRKLSSAPGIIIDFDNGEQEDFGRINSVPINPYLNSNSDALFKAFKYLSSKRYELVTSVGDFRYVVQYTFRRERK